MYKAEAWGDMLKLRTDPCQRVRGLRAPWDNMVTAMDQVVSFLFFLESLGPSPELPKCFLYQ